MIDDKPARPSNPTAPEGVTPPPARRPYSKPTITDLGSVAELTAGGSGTKTDGDFTNVLQ